MGGCSFPANASSPIGEDQLFTGFPQPESAGYSMAKAMGVVAGTAYQQQYGVEYSILIPGNMYGEFDNFDLEASHVIPAMLRKFHEAKLYGTNEIVLWGSGKPVGDFVYAGDVASAIPKFISENHGIGPYNISSGVEVSIRDLCDLVGNVVGYEGKIIWDDSMPDGQMEKIFDVQRSKKMGIEAFTDLRSGLEKTYEWFAKNYEAKTDGLRL